MTSFASGSTMLDLNQATASLRATEPLQTTVPIPGPHFKAPSASVFVTAMALFSIIALYLFKPITFAKATNYAQWVASNMVVYALTDSMTGPNIYQEAKDRRGSLETKKANRGPRTPRSDFSLSSSLDFCSLVASTRQEIAPAMNNTLMRATLDRPAIDSVVCKNCICCQKSACQVPASMYEAQLDKIHMEELKQDKKSKKIQDLSRNGLGKKPDLRRLKNLDLIPVSRSSRTSKLLDFNLDEAEDEEDEHDWESDPRVSPVLCGDNMEGEDAGCTPCHQLILPSAVKKAKDHGICGRSLLTVENEPTLSELYPTRTRSVVENKKFLGWDVKKSLKQTERKTPNRTKQTDRKNALFKGRKPNRQKCSSISVG